MVIFETHLSRYGPDHDMARTLRALFSLGYRVPLVSSSSDRGAERLRSLGYKAEMRVATDGIYRTLFSEIKTEDAISLICESGGLRTVVLSRADA